MSKNTPKHSNSYHIHVDAVGVRPSVLEVLLQPLSEGVGDLMEADEFFDSQHLEVIPGRARVQPLDDGRHVPEDAGVHQSWRNGPQLGVGYGRLMNETSENGVATYIR